MSSPSQSREYRSTLTVNSATFLLCSSSLASSSFSFGSSTAAPPPSFAAPPSAAPSAAASPAGGGGAEANLRRRVVEEEEELTREGVNRGREEEAIDLEGMDRATDRRTLLESIVKRWEKVEGGEGGRGIEVELLRESRCWEERREVDDDPTFQATARRDSSSPLPSFLPFLSLSTSTPLH